MISSVQVVDDNQVDHLNVFLLKVRIAHKDSGSEPEIDTLRKEVAQEKECAIRAEAPSLKGRGASLLG